MFVLSSALRESKGEERRGWVFGNVDLRLREDATVFVSSTSIILYGTMDWLAYFSVPRGGGFSAVGFSDNSMWFCLLGKVVAHLG